VLEGKRLAEEKESICAQSRDYRKIGNIFVSPENGSG